MRDACMVRYVDMMPGPIKLGAAAMVKNGDPRHGYNTTLGSGALEPLAKSHGNNSSIGSRHKPQHDRHDEQHRRCARSLADPGDGSTGN